MAPTWLSGVKAVAQSVAGALPALILVIFAGVLSLLGLVCEEGRRSYALAYADRFVDLAAVLVGRPRKAPRPNVALHRPPDRVPDHRT
ncbi:MAG: hypothetical protein ACRDQY_08550 [Pseudonocardiaceae bacterium]